MQTAKEIFLELLKPEGRPERVLRQYEALHMCLYDPINTYLRGRHHPVAGDGTRAGSGGQLHRGLGGMPPQGPGHCRGAAAGGRLYGHGHI